jgi:hypothetical protein
MFEVTLTIHFPNGRTEKLPLSTDRLTIAQSNADLLVEDSGLANHRASIYRDGQRVWILDEDFLSCSYVNGAPVPRDGRLLKNGDKITIGDYTTIWVNMSQEAKTTVAKQSKVEMHSPLMWASLVPIVIFVVLAVALGSRLIGKSGDAVKNQSVDNRDIFVNDNRNETTITPTNQNRSQSNTSTANTNTQPDNVISQNPDGVSTTPGSTKRYLQMSESERLQFVTSEAKRISGVIGNRPCEFTNEVLAMIKNYVDSYAKRAGNKSTKLWAEDTQSVYLRASTFAPMIIVAFNRERVNPIVGLYIPMIETEYHNKLTSPANCKGMFQFMPSTAAGYGVHGEEIWEVTKTAPACAKYMKDRLSEFGGDATAVALAIAGYNRSPDSVRRDLQTVFENSPGEERDRSFWSLIAKKGMLDHWFQNENIKYPPKFYAAAILGENPKVFNLPLTKPLSTYTEVK